RPPPGRMRRPCADRQPQKALSRSPPHRRAFSFAAQSGRIVALPLTSSTPGHPSHMVAFRQHEEHAMSAYAIAHLRQVTMGPDIVAYLARIDATLGPFGGGFPIHGGPVDLLEGSWTGDLIAIEFPDR